jgi:hypothetical protein
LQYGEFLIHTDQKSLIHLNEQYLHTPWQQKVFTKLLGLQYKIVYKKGSDNHVVDALSQRTSPAEVMAIYHSTPQWLEAVIASYAQDLVAVGLVPI